MAWKNLPSNFGNANRKGGMDALDLEAEAEGNAVRSFSTNYAPENKPKGRRLQRNDNKSSRGAAIVGSKRVVNLTKDHTEVCRNLGVRPS